MTSKITIQRVNEISRKMAESAPRHGAERYRDILLTEVLPALGIKIEREFKDGDIVYGSRVSGLDRVLYVRRDGEWQEICLDSRTPRTFIDAAMREHIENGQLSFYEQEED